MKMDFAVPCLLGMEAPIAEELRSFGAENVAAENGRVLFSGGTDILARANIRSRFSERVLILLGSFEAHSFEELFQGTKALPWEEWIGKTDAFPVKGYSLDSDLFSVRDCQSIIKKAVVDRLSSFYGIEWFREEGPVHQIQFSIMKNNVSLMLDTSGAGLHKRGYRPQANAAPIKETLAAALCHFSRLRSYHTLYDPMCGSGTIAIEGALLARNVSPGVNRSFSAEKWDQIPADVWTEEREAARAAEQPGVPFMAYASDIDPEAVKVARKNAEAAGVADCIDFSVADVADFEFRTERGTLIVNPPYGERLSDYRQTEKLYRSMGRLFVPKHGWSYSIITADEDFERSFGRKADKRRKLYNGMIKCQLYMYFK